MAPFGQPIGEADGTVPTPLQVPDGVIGEQAIRGDVDGARKRAGRVLGRGTDIDDDHLAAIQPRCEFLATDPIDATAVAQLATGRAGRGLRVVTWRRCAAPSTAIVVVATITTLSALDVALRMRETRDHDPVPADA